jgi:hypothetical protein
MPVHPRPGPGPSYPPGGESAGFRQRESKTQSGTVGVVCQPEAHDDTMNPISSAAIIKAPYVRILLSPSRLCSCNARESILGLRQLTILGICPSEERRERQDDEDDRANGEL